MTLTITKPRKHKTWLLPYLHGKTSQVTFFVKLTTTERKENEAKIVSDMQHHFPNKKV